MCITIFSDVYVKEMIVLYIYIYYIYIYVCECVCVCSYISEIIII